MIKFLGTRGKFFLFETCVGERAWFESARRRARERAEEQASEHAGRAKRVEEKKNFPPSGFTIIEMVIIFGIVSLLSATLVVSLRVGEQSIALFKEQARIISAISRAKSLSVATFGLSGEVPCAYGVHFDKNQNSFFIFTDLPVDDDCQNADNKYDDGEAMSNESFQLDISRVVFDNVSLDDIVFIPPNPKVVIWPDQAVASIVLKTISGDNSATIKVNRAGQISTD